MKTVLRIFAKMPSLLVALVLMTFLIGTAQVADAPPLEALNPDEIACYLIVDGGRIVDSDGRMRGWIKGNEVYGPDLELKYRLTGRRLEVAP